MYLVDTNIISEARKGKKANPGVQKFVMTTAAEDLYLSAQQLVNFGEDWRTSGIEVIYPKPGNLKNGLIWL